MSSEISGSAPENDTVECDSALEIKKWAIENRVSHNVVTHLLQVLRRIGVKDLPLSAKTLFKTNKKKAVIQSIPSGEFLYRGIQYHFKIGAFAFLHDKDEVQIDVGIDGLKLYNSSSKVLWPILGAIVGFPNEYPFTIACFSGTEKPWNVNDYLKDFCEEVIYLKENGLQVGSNPIKKKFDIRLFCCDTPARAFVTGVQSHNGKNSCSKCDQVGSYVNKRICFSKKVHNLRSDVSFKYRAEPAHHSSTFRTCESILEKSGFKMVSQFPLDPMHLVDLGVTKKLTQLLMKRANVTKINEKINFLSKYVPTDFGRVCRDFNEINNWKSTEYRQFLLYIGIFVLKDCIGSDFYFLFLLLHTGIRLLSSQKSLQTEADVAQNILQEFVHLFGQIFGDYLVSYNVHGLLHITDCARQYGTLDSFSAYKFENYMQYLKKIVKKPNKILEQIHFRLEEGNDVENISKIGAFKIDHKKEKDSYCFSRKVGPVKIIGIGDYLIGYSFGKLENYFDQPVQSAPALGIILGDQLGNEEIKIPKEDIAYKYFCIPHEGKHLLIPVLHHLFHVFEN
ncbi:uncharacterized protein LOC129249819 [Anastrepha obliqua]|uniref:uncharacterized protein LOC129249819 n=1 Tax=Anastrepha obliqua TaxID=95512 RepID=UPI00240A37F8|nr:uncharacterized protein LOC129249819 [Anastrepha obliqua]